MLLTPGKHDFLWSSTFPLQVWCRPFFSAIAGVDHWSLQLISPHVWGITSISSFLQISCRKMCLRWLYNVLTEWADVISSFMFNQIENKSTNMCLTKVARKHFPNSCFNVSQNIYPLVSCHIFWPQYLNHLKQAEWSTSYQSDLPKNIQYFIFGQKQFIS